MREFKFRVWDKETLKMYADNDVIIMFGGILEEVDIRRNNTVDELIDYKLMQYTGLKDKNGKEIYEGDIVKYESPYFKVMGRIILGFYVEWFISKDVKDKLGEIRSDLGDWVEEIEVIGNIYENIELLNNK